MEQKNKDFLLFYDWFKIMRNMSHKHAHMLLNAMVEYQAEGIEPPEFPDKIKDVATLMFDQLRRRMENQINGKKGGEARARAARSADADGTDASSAPKAPGEAEPYAYRQDKDKTKQDYLSIADRGKREERYGAPRERAREGYSARSENTEPYGGSTFTDDFFDAAVRRSLALMDEQTRENDKSS